MKKFIALVIISIFVFGLVPFAFAASNGTLGDKIEDIKDVRENVREKRLETLRKHLPNDKDKLKKISGLNNTDIDRLSALNRARLKELTKLDEARLKIELKKVQVLKVRNAADLNKRNISESELAELKEKFENAKEKYKTAKEELQDSRKDLRQAVQRNDKNATLTHAKNYLLHSADALINHLEKIKAKIQENENLPNETEARIVAEINMQINEINIIKSQIEAATTREEIKEAARRLHEKWKKLKHLIKLYAYRIVSARVEGIVNFGLVLEKRLDKILEKANESGIEVDISAELELFSQKIATSRDKYKQAQAKLTEALDLRASGEPADSGKIRELIDEAKALLKQSRDSLKEAHETLKTIVKKIKEAIPNADLSSEIEVEVAAEASSSEVETEVNATAGANAQAST